MKKGFLKGFLLGTLIFGSATAFAITYNATTASFPIFVNGQEWTTDKPIVVIDGSTYLPLKALGEALNVKINWNSELNRVEIGETLSDANTYSRKNPAPIRTSQTIKVSDFSEEYSATVTIEEVIRGIKAWNKIEDANMFNDEAGDEYEYILAKIKVSIDSVKDDKAISISKYNFDCYSIDNVKYDSASVVTPEPILSTDIYEGGSKTGYAVFRVKKTDAAPKLSFGTKYDGTGGIWFSL
jgi:hypothetical protein